MTQPDGKQTVIFVNGKPQDVVYVLDRGFNYGDGIFETIRVVNHQLTLWSYHRERLLLGAQRLKISFDIDVVENELTQACKVQPNSIVKLIITRGVGGRGYTPAAGMQASRVISVHELPVYPTIFYDEGIALHVCDVRIGSQPLLAGIKHLNRLEQVMGGLELMHSDCAEGLLLDEHGYVIEGTRTNLFIVIDSVLTTPDLSHAGVDGVMRQFVLKEAAASHHIRYQVTNIDMNLVAKADEVFVCNSVNGIWPVSKIGSLSFDVGRITRLLQASVKSALQL